jgi:hypothetical protein
MSRYVHEILAEKPEWTASRRRWENNINVYLRETWYDNEDWLGVNASDRLL